MTITSGLFAAFSAITLAVYYTLPHRGQNYLLLAASCVAIAAWDVMAVLIFLALTAANYGLGLRIARRTRSSVWALRGGIALNIAVLVYLKYMDFFVPQLTNRLDALDVVAVPGALRLAVPVGLSFYVVQALSYLFDVDKRVSAPVTNPVSFALYMLYFPRFVAGPLERARELVPQFEAPRAVDDAQIRRGLALVLNGLVRKVVLADTLLALLPQDVFSAPEQYSAPALTIWLLAYAFALLNDFAGYTSIVRGVSSLFGIELSPNFHAPYFASSFAEFWQRWHITFSNWLRDYVFLPFSRVLLRRKFRPNHWLSITAPPLVTMFVSALWHEASWNMLLWGGLHGVYLAAERAYRVRRPLAARRDPGPRQTVMVFVFVVLAWVPFRMALPQVIAYWGGLLALGEWVTDGQTVLSQVAVINCLLLMLAAGWLDMRVARRGELAWTQRPALAQALLINTAVVAILIALAAQSSSPPPFVYQGF